MRSPIRAELHSHSTFSDGTYAPEVVAQLCHDAGVELWSLTDHDTCAGCPSAAEAAAELGVDFIPGIEISAFADRSIHVLGYGVDPQSDVIQNYSTKRLQARHDRMLLMIDRLAELGVDVPFDVVQRIAGEGAIARPHLARALVEVGVVASVQEAFDRWISNSGKAYIETPWPKVPDAIAMVTEAGGVSVLAHPGVYERDDLIGGWVDAGLGGIEVRHPKHDAAAERRYGTMAQEFGVFSTASSDYHGPDRVGANLFGHVELDPEWIDALRDRIS